MNSRQKLLLLVAVLAICCARVSLGNGTLLREEQTESIHPAGSHPLGRYSGKERSEPIEVVELHSLADFRRILMQFPSEYEGHDQQWEYLSASYYSKDPLNEDGLDENGLPGHNWMMVYKIQRGKIPKGWLLKVIREKGTRLKEQWPKVVPGQLAFVTAFEEWMLRTKPKVDEEIEKEIETVRSQLDVNTMGMGRR